MSVSIRRNNAGNETTVHVGALRIDFSYETPIAFWFDGERVVRQNRWSTTTGKHLNRIDGGSAQAKKERVTGEEFTRLLDEALAKVGL